MMCRICHILRFVDVPVPQIKEEASMNEGLALNSNQGQDSSINRELGRPDHFASILHDKNPRD